MMDDQFERSAYPHPDEFKVMRPEYTELPEEDLMLAVINIAPFRVIGKSTTKAGARRAALYTAEQTYRSYHPNYAVQNPYPDAFTDENGTTWKILPPSLKTQYQADYEFTDADGSDYTDIATMLLWDIRIAEG